MLRFKTAILPWICLIVISPAIADDRAPKPLFREFMGINGHTIQFRADQYAKACTAVRDYHPMDWDTGKDTSSRPPFPFATNGVDWKTVYGKWKAAGCETNACIMFDNFPAKDWKEPARDARAYGEAFATAFGSSSGGLSLVKAVEIGNEPGLYDDPAYRTIFENMARGVRKGDPRMKIGTCAIAIGAGDRYSKSVKCVEGLEPLYDYLNIHSYAEAEGWPTWRRTFPEDRKVDFLRRVEDLIAWRDRHAPGKEVRVTEFGWDASSKPAPKSGDFAKWVGSTETQQAQYLVRSFLLFSKLDVTRAYLFFFDDKDEPQVHGSSGLTRNGVPKPAFYAVEHLRKTLGDYRFHKVIREEPSKAFIYEFTRDGNARNVIWAAWSPTADQVENDVQLDLTGKTLSGYEVMPLTKDFVPSKSLAVRDGKVTIRLGESPTYLKFRSIEE